MYKKNNQITYIKVIILLYRIICFIYQASLIHGVRSESSNEEKLRDEKLMKINFIYKSEFHSSRK